MIKTDRLIIKDINESDRINMIKMFKNDEIIEFYMIPKYDNDEEYDKLFESFLSLSKLENRFVKGIYLNNTIIGFINDLGIKDKKVELGYAINPKYHNQGFMTEALNASIKHLLDNGCNEVICGAFENNIRSIRVMKKCGMNLMDKIDYITYNQINQKCVYYNKI